MRRTRKPAATKAGEKTYRVHVSYWATSIEDVVASSPEEASQRFVGSGSLCHQCIGEYEIGDPCKVLVIDPDTEEETEFDI